MKKILYCSNPSHWATGLGKHTKTLLKGLYRKGYEIVEYAAALSENDPLVNNVPWKRYGSLPSNNILKQLQAEGRGRDLSFVQRGAFFIDKVIKEEKPDVAIFVEDIWQIDEWLVNKPWWNKIPSVIWTPVDSLPVISNFINNKDKLKNIWVKADFAVKPLEEIGLKPKLLPALFEKKDFYPLKEEEKKNLKKQLGLEDTFVIGFVFRNQLRKLVISLFEAFKKFKERNPEVKAKLLLHTCWDEPHGWKIKEGLDRVGLNNDDVITTYICRKCKNIALVPYAGQGQNCNGCRTQGSVFNPTVDNGVSEEELNMLYNVMDCYVHLATSGGFEMPMAEAMFAGLPTATMAYSFGEMFVNSGFCEPVEYTFYRDGVSFFLKSQPNIDSVCNVMEKFYYEKDKYKEIGLKGREWALARFDNETIINQVADFIESTNHSYDFNFELDSKKTQSVEDFIVDKNNKKLLYVIPESLDYCFASLAVIEELKKVYPKYDFYISCDINHSDVFSHLKFIQNIIPYHPDMDNFSSIEGSGDNKGIFDIVFHPSAMTDKFVSYHHNGEDINTLQNV